MRNGRFYKYVYSLVCMHVCSRDLIFAIEDNADDHNKHEYIWESQLKSAEKKLVAQKLQAEKKVITLPLWAATTTIKNIKND